MGENCFKDRMDGKPAQTRHMKVDVTGQVHESTFEEARKDHTPNSPHGGM